MKSRKFWRPLALIMIVCARARSISACRNQSALLGLGRPPSSGTSSSDMRDRSTRRIGKPNHYIQLCRIPNSTNQRTAHVIREAGGERRAKSHPSKAAGHQTTRNPRNPILAGQKKGKNEDTNIILHWASNHMDTLQFWNNFQQLITTTTTTTTTTTSASPHTIHSHHSPFDPSQIFQFHDKFCTLSAEARGVAHR
jgi:hypothetical protein